MLVDEIETLKLLETRANFDRYAKRIPVHALSDNTADLVAALARFFAGTKVETISWDAFGAWHRQDYKSSATPAERALYDAIIARVRDHKPDPQVVAVLTQAWAKAGLIQDAANILADIRTGRSDVAPDAALDSLVRAYRGATPVSGATVNASCLTEFALQQAGAAASGEGFDWGLEDLNASVGPLRRGDFVLVGGRPEIGKTSLVVQQTAAMLRGRSDVALWINNEESDHRILLRYLSAILGRPAKDLRQHIPEALTAVYSRGWKSEQVRIFDAHAATIGAIEDEIERVNPTFLILHMLDKMPQLRMDKNANEVQRIAALAFWARRQAAAGRIVIGVCQADGSANGKKYVYDNQLYGSKTKLQAESDAIITVGAEQVFDEVRGLHVPRNKLVGGARSNEAKRHGFFDVKFDHVTGRYETILYRSAQ